MFKVHHSAVHLHKFASVIIIFPPKKNPRNNYKAHIFNIHCKAKYDRNLLLLSLMSMRVISPVKKSFHLKF